MKLRVSVVICGALVLVSGIVTAQTDLQRAAARDAAAAGSSAYEAGRYEDALESLSRAEALVHAPTHLLLIARAEAKLGRLVAAHETYVKILRESLPTTAPKVFADARTAAAQEKEDLEQHIPAITVRLQGVGVTAKDVVVVLDDTPLSAAMIGLRLPVDPGSHVLSAKSPSAAAAPVTVVVADGAAEDVVLTLAATGATSESSIGAAASEKSSSTPAQADSRPSSHGWPRIGSYVAFGVGAVGLGLGTFFLVKSGGTRGDANQLFDACNAGSPSGKCSDPSAEKAIVAKDADADSQRNLGVGALIAGGAGVAAGALLLLIDGKSGSGQAHAAPPSIMPVVGLGSVGAVGTF